MACTCTKLDAGISLWVVIRRSNDEANVCVVKKVTKP